MKSPYCGEDFWVSRPRWGIEVCHKCGADKPKKEEQDD